MLPSAAITPLLAKLAADAARYAGLEAQLNAGVADPKEAMRLSRSMAALGRVRRN